MANFTKNKVKNLQGARGCKVPVFLLFNEKIQITKFLPKKFCRDFQQISMSLVKIGQNKW